MNGDEQHILQKHLAKFLVKEVFNTVSTDDILRIERSKNPIKPDVWFYKGQPLQKAHIELLKTQSTSFAESELWKILKTEIRWQAEQRGLIKSTTEADLIASKMMLYLLDVIESKLGDMSQ
jgi:hypothetical protein